MHHDKDSLFRYKLIIAYDGTNYSGWQQQKGKDSIQELILKAIKKVTQESDCKLIGSGRTDAGVHAEGQVAHFTLHESITNLARFQRSLNGLLPADIRILDISLVTLTFHAQKSAIGKIYHYNLCLRDIVLPRERLYCSHITKPVNLNLLKKALSCFVGEYDFSSFSNSQSEGSCAKNPVRTIYSIDVVTTENGVQLQFYGSGFLYKMVRNITGMALDVATGKRNLEEIPLVLAAKDRRLASKVAEAKGLSLVRVFYP